MANSFKDFIDSGTKGTFNKVFLAGYFADIAKSDNKIKAVLKSLKEFALYNTKLFLPVTFITAWTGLNHTIRAILKDTGSLDAALRRMSTIQGFQRTFAPLLGGLEAAKRRVAELIQLSAKGPFKFEELASASRSLEVMTRGSFSGNKALSQIQNTAAATGNSVEDAATSIGKFYAELRSGQPIAAASEELRQMGIISQGTSDTLQAMAQHGASNAEVFDELTKSMAGTSEALRSLSEDAASIQKSHEKATEGLQNAFGQPFAEKDLQNTKNYTAAMLAVTPAVGRVAQFLSTLTTAFSATKSQLVATVAQSQTAVSAFEFLAKAIATVIAAGAALGSISVGVMLTGWAASLGAMGGAAAIAGVALAGLGTALVALPFVIGAGILINYTAQLNRATDAMLALGKANAESTNKLKQQISDIKTLADWHEALTAALQAETQAQDQLNDAKSKEKSRIDKEVKGLQYSGAVSPEEIAKLREDKTGTSDAVIEAQRNFFEKKRITQKLAKTGPGANLTSQEYKEAYRKSAELALEGEERAYEEVRSRPGVGTVAAIKQRAGVLQGREDTAEAGRKAAADLPRRREEAAAKVEVAKKELEAAQLQNNADRIKKAQTALARANASATNVGLGAPAGTSTRLNAEAEAARKRGNFKLQSQLEVQSEIAKQREGDTSQRGRAMRLEAEEAERAEATAREQERLEMSAKQTRRGTAFGGPGPLAQPGGPAAAEKIEDTLRFAHHYDELSHLPEEERRRRATALAQQDIIDTANPRGPAQVASSLARIGGGGGVYAPGGDPMVRLAERQRSLLESINSYLGKIANFGGGVK